MMNRRQVLRALVSAAVAISPKVFAQEARKIPRIGMLGLNSGELLQPVREGLLALGYVDGKNIRLEERAAGDQYEKLGEIARELVKLNVDVIVTSGTTATTAAQRATASIPIVMIVGVDPVKAGFAASLARPGGNITGLTSNIHEASIKQIELAKELVPGLTRVGALVNPDSRAATTAVREAEAAAKRLKLMFHLIEIHSSDQFEDAFQKLSRVPVQASVVLPSSMIAANRKTIIRLAEKFRLPCVYSTSNWVEDGGLSSYGGDTGKLRREAARYIDRILRGTKPAELAIEQPSTLELAVNLKAARALGLKIPNVVLLRADKVIE